MILDGKGKTAWKVAVGVLVVLVLVLGDQISKQAAVEYLKYGPDIILIPGVIQLHYLENTGIAFSFLEGKMTLFYILTPILAGIMIYIFFRTPARRRFLPMLICCLLLIAGAAGNLIDRVTFQYVIDFIYFSLIDFPVFNVADIYVTLGAAILFYEILFSSDRLDELLELLWPGKKKKED